jgi:hypothetical protein
LRCFVCACIARDAVSHGCGVIFCAECWELPKDGGPPCPACGSGSVVNAPAEAARSAVMQLPFHCLACEMVVAKLADKSAHAMDCHPVESEPEVGDEVTSDVSDQSPRIDDNSDATGICNACKSALPSTSLADRDAHALNVCPYRRVSCPACGISSTALAVDAHAVSECPVRRTQCPDCGWPVTPATYEDHKVTACVFRFISCPICSTVIRQRELLQHLTDGVPQHLLFLSMQSEVQLGASRENYQSFDCFV